MDAYLIDAVRSPVGRRGGALSGVHPADLAGHVITALLERTGVDPAAVDDVILGCVDTLGPQAGDIARTAWLVAGLPEHVPGVTVDRQCGSSQQALHFAAQAVASGTAELVVAGGVQNMSMVPIASAMTVGEQFGFATPFTGSPGWEKRYGNQEISQFRAAELIAARWNLSRARMEEYALRSHQRAVAAIDAGAFANELVPLGDAVVDEGPRRDTSAAKMAGLPPLVEGGRVTAATASQISDGASAVLVASGRAVRSQALAPRARVHHISARGDDPVMMLTAPIPATRHALERTGLRIEDIDVFEVNEAFASVVLAWLAETGADPERVNTRGGAIALGHPLGATGTKLCATLLNALEHRSGRYGLQVMCEGGGQANVTILERL
jgi:acetyl-CoA C-acetyltransferase